MNKKTSPASLIAAITAFAGQGIHSPSRAALAQHVGVSVRTVTTLLHECESSGSLIVNRRGGKPNIYQLAGVSVTPASWDQTTASSEVTAANTPASWNQTPATTAASSILTPANLLRTAASYALFPPAPLQVAGVVQTPASTAATLPHARRKSGAWMRAYRAGTRARARLKDSLYSNIKNKDSSSAPKTARKGALQNSAPSRLALITTSGMTEAQLEAQRSAEMEKQRIEDERRYNRNANRTALEGAVGMLWQIAGPERALMVAMLEGRQSGGKRDHKEHNEQAAHMRNAPVTADELLAWEKWYRQRHGRDISLPKKPQTLISSLLGFREAQTLTEQPVITSQLDAKRRLAGMGLSDRLWNVEPAKTGSA